MRIIDAHVHLYPPELSAAPAAWAAARGETHWATLCTRCRKDGRPVQTFPSVDELLREMDRAGVERAVLLGWYWERPETCVVQNRFQAGCVRAHPGRLTAFATVHPCAGLGPTLNEIQHASDEGFAGLGELSPHAQGYGVDEPVFRAALARAGELKLPVNLHVTDPAGADYPGRVDTPLEDFVRLARECSQTTFVLSHWGGLLPLRSEWAAEARILKNILYDTAASPLLYDAGVWSRFLAVVPAGRVLFGSDFPLNLYPRLDEVPGLVRLVEEARRGGSEDDVMGENAKRLLRL